MYRRNPTIFKPEYENHNGMSAQIPESMYRILDQKLADMIVDWNNADVNTCAHNAYHLAHYFHGVGFADGVLVGVILEDIFKQIDFALAELSLDIDDYFQDVIFKKLKEGLILLQSASKARSNTDIYEALKHLALAATEINMITTFVPLKPLEDGD